MGLLRQLSAGFVAFAIGWTLSTIVYVIVVGRLVWDGELD